jgi:hypothetical protein
MVDDVGNNGAAIEVDENVAEEASEVDVSHKAYTMTVQARSLPKSLAEKFFPRPTLTDEIAAVAVVHQKL